MFLVEIPVALRLYRCLTLLCWQLLPPTGSVAQTFGTKCSIWRVLTQPFRTPVSIKDCDEVLPEHASLDPPDEENDQSRQ
jgi:hypothetical protein